MALRRKSAYNQEICDINMNKPQIYLVYREDYTSILVVISEFFQKLIPIISIKLKGLQIS